MDGRDRSPRACPRVATASGDCPAISAALADALADCAPALVLFFSADGQLVRPLSGMLSRALGPDCRVLGCSSAGGFSFEGYDDDSVIAVAFPAAAFRAEAVWLSRLRQHMALDWMASLRRLDERFPPAPGQTRFGLLLIDGMSGREELVTATVEATLPGLMVLGGSAGDGLRFSRTHLAMDGEARQESALFCLITTDFDVEEVVFDHFVPVGQKMIVTDADPENRLIREINGEPAAEEYARLIGLRPEELEPRAFAENPLLVRHAGRHYVRAIIAATADGGLSLMSSVEPGTVLTIGRAESLTDGLRLRMEQIGPAELVLGFDCVLRRIALEQAGEQGTVRRLCQDYRIAGFNTYGEQHGGIHVNQTFVGLAFLDRPDGDDHAPRQ